MPQYTSLKTTPPQATGYQPEYFYRPQGRGIKTLSAAGGLVRSGGLN